MTPEDLRSAARVIVARFRRYLEEDAGNVLIEAVGRAETLYSRFCSQLRTSKNAYAEPWSFRIEPSRPLLFRPVQCRKLTLQPDICCQLMWDKPDSPPSLQNTLVRVWSLDPDVIYRGSLDSDCFRDTRPDRRVMVRFHFDVGSVGQPGPRTHLQVGGKAGEDEYCWLHPSLTVPRLAHPPLDLVLACEVVVANFLPDSARKELQDPGWRMALLRSQQEFLAPFYDTCIQAIEDEESVLQSLWNFPW